MWKLVLLISALLFVAACGERQDQSQLQVVNHSPAVEATATPDATVSMAFSEPINSATVDSSSFRLSNQGGAVSGTLQINGSNITFTPNKPLSLFCKYTATVSPTVYGVYGHMLAQSYQWSFTTRDGLWDMFEPPRGSESNTSQAAIDDNGRVMLAWSTTAGTYASFLVNGAWAAPVLLGEGGYLYSVVAANDSYAVFWQVNNGNTIKMYCARFVDGAWQPAETFATMDAVSFNAISTIFSDNSLFVIYMFNGGADGAQAYSRRFIPNRGWQPPVALAEQNAWFVGGFHRSGKAVIAWANRGNALNTGYAQSYDVNSGWSAPVAIGEYAYLTAHSAAVNSSGKSMVAFSTMNDIRIASTTPGAGWTPLVPVYQKQAGDLYAFYTIPQIAMDDLGNAMLVTSETSASSHRHLAIRYDSNNGWQQPVDISGGRRTDLLLHNSLQVDESGNYLLVWYGYDTSGGSEHIYSSRYQNGIGWSSPTYLCRQDVDAAFAKVSMNSRGEAVAVWLYFYPSVMGLGVGLFH
ncbi:Ig-like domain-containing protein [Geomobilimonas luticola]|uniref:Ig-like domain-containing protein n=1 Tax=Geomobilimonas luticola TaxID=1114878 RepID=A0ABS5SG82_9BACT|nr:Ig-like domain-containing protein [Geomobilimonas luticola]MBT0653519.1 Ig-like domain-containing protein [Geomobilimonas luticola]